MLPLLWPRIMQPRKSLFVGVVVLASTFTPFDPFNFRSGSGSYAFADTETVFMEIDVASGGWEL